MKPKESAQEIQELKLTLETTPFKPIETPLSKKFLKDKLGNKISITEFFKRWGEGIKNLTPAQKITNEARATAISTIGSFICLIALIIFKDKLIVSWFAYGLILVFVGSTWNGALKWIILRQQLKYFKDFDSKSIDINEILKGGKTK